jgi:hypothetical protein
VPDEPELTQKLKDQLAKAGLPLSGTHPFRPRLTKNRRGEMIVERAQVFRAPAAQAGRVGWVDTDGRIWLRDHAHAGLPDHWDVQEDGGKTYFRVDGNGNLLG